MALSRAKLQVAREAAQQMEMAQNMPIPKTEIEKSEKIIGASFLDLPINHFFLKKKAIQNLLQGPKTSFYHSKSTTFRSHDELKQDADGLATWNYNTYIYNIFWTQR